MLLCSYVVTKDYGFAPNPFWGYCTVATCTPNHQDVRLDAGDWIMGHSPKDDGRRLIYAMKVAETLDYNEYFHDERFQAKKPRRSDTWMEQCGDNIYSRCREGSWRQHFTIFHDDDVLRSKDARYHKVFISEQFYYFGENLRPIPSRFSSLLVGRCGCKKRHDQDTVDKFVKWMLSHLEQGVHGGPRHLDEWKKDPSTR